MKIEEVLVTNKFENEYHKAALNVIYTSNFIQSLLKERTDKEKITLQQYNVLRILRGQNAKPATVNMLKERLLDRMSDVSRIIDRLVQKGLVSRCMSHKDRRAVDIFITHDGMTILERLDKKMSILSVLDENLSEEECKQLNYLLDKLRG
ncbi:MULTISPECIES: MarR family winged helix-turn-helix transcriptional regulator [Olivibacter]|jgi:DNA-binding MarR family transcriptional regulator|uniref:Regulatory protein MarR n=3 Tax=Sphingobacteriaceae TaxID=84566 RepID=F4C616_SPHS2|nr:MULTISPECIES: MarR family transcriptional regulator [Olivibacter]MCL4640872.1 MarR family transcriptional regulator [Olivibacter sp. UJ_SKK_5.1]MDM8175733.1 MarR family transcriptional regulator [Olivibacter sp. 47]MDX3914340.1 MarR family transcriptional regulator [Pseudosphingobacterium sp.]QEL02466.1 MarR family transcriptional regulator [Olivibacter sp. LS-1]